MDNGLSVSLDNPEARGSEPEQAWPRQYIEAFEDCGKMFLGGKTFMDDFREDQYGEERRTNPYYPWASKQEWDFALWLLHSGLSMAAINYLLSLKIVSDCTSVCLTF